ncbi:hypothetical protein AUR04nite_28600 [Glutamicibacter uratoxydans]|uniref:Uncharacterized protein n=1 Tax=Glutamicibacter uratoxydans TaxID=43667 RepID=A0A4Y4DVD4_GLUUR|nr:hypothetical protein [Glutamicibacter uratoxydans]GED07328.1 hypothetical protein AUR04nite_28600 [Glutamicibacter uratoxydans]
MSELTKSRWGRMRSGGSTRKLLGISLGGGLAIALALGSLAAVLGYPQQIPLALAGYSISFWLPFSALIWVLLVDRETITGAPKDVEQSIESRWAERAGAAVFRDMLLFLGLGAGVLSFLQFKVDWFLEVPLGLAFALVLSLLLIDFAIRYQLIKRTEG